MSKNKPVKRLRNRSKKFKETSLDCQNKKPILNNKDIAKNHKIKCNKRENLPDNSIFLNIEDKLNLTAIFKLNSELILNCFSNL